MNSNIEAFSTIAAANFGGTLYIEYIPKQWLVNDLIPNPLTGELDKNIILVTGKSWLVPSFAYDTAIYSETPKSEKGNSYFEAELEFRINMDQRGLATLLARHRDHEYVIRIRDMHSVTRVCGTRRKGMKFLPKFSTGQRRTGVNGFSISLVMLIPMPAPYYTYVPDNDNGDPDSNSGGGSLLL